MYKELCSRVIELVKEKEDTVDEYEEESYEEYTDDPTEGVDFTGTPFEEE